MQGREPGHVGHLVPDQLRGQPAQLPVGALHVPGTVLPMPNPNPNPNPHPSPSPSPNPNPNPNPTPNQAPKQGAVKKGTFGQWGRCPDCYLTVAEMSVGRTPKNNRPEGSEY